MSHNGLGWVAFQMLFLLLGLKGRGKKKNWQMCIHPEKPTTVFHVRYVKKNRERRCGAMKPQPTQTYTDKQNKHAAKLFSTYTQK